jgi:hypothetical protein
VGGSIARLRETKTANSIYIVNSQVKRTPAIRGHSCKYNTKTYIRGSYSEDVNCIELAQDRVFSQAFVLYIPNGEKFHDRLNNYKLPREDPVEVILAKNVYVQMFVLVSLVWHAVNTSIELSPDFDVEKFEEVFDISL